jgi:nucleoside-diphosphate-sugar epimerase
MRVFVDGAAGFLGRHVVRAIAERGHAVRVLVRPSREVSDDAFPSGVEVVKGDLLRPETFRAALRGVNAVVHLAIGVVGDREIQLVETVQGTANLCNAMVGEEVRRIVHCSSLTVYDYGRAAGVLDESSLLEASPEDRDEYAKAKLEQEELVQKYTSEHNWATTIFRPGFIWGQGRMQMAGWGHPAGPIWLVVGASRPLRLTFVENCAQCFALAIDQPRAAGEVFNIVDDDLPTAWKYAGLLMKLNEKRVIRATVPYSCGLCLAQLATGVNRFAFRGLIKLPGLLVPSRYRARFSSIDYSNRKAKELLGWRPRFAFDEAWARCVGSTQVADTEAARMGVAPEEAMRGK